TKPLLEGNVTAKATDKAENPNTSEASEPIKVTDTTAPTKPLPEGNITAKATDKAETPNTSETSEPMKSTDTTPPAKPVIQTDLTGKGGTTEPITIQAEPGSKVELFDKDGNKIGEGIADDQGNAVITPTKPLSEGNVTAKATDKAENPNTSE
ncbi:YSIRK signal domain/LPXTG anchor domain surface protein, partial [Gemella sp. 19428wG2_WT2a]|nr:YSIRK signal domain/LPXTG anchor domain surface protein [Gemella sp. 19428wG2_WT2a]